MKPYSDEADAKFEALKAKQARGEKVEWADLLGICQPNPDLPDCQSWEGGYEHKCQLDKGHEGPHRHVLEWGA